MIINVFCIKFFRIDVTSDQAACLLLKWRQVIDYRFVKRGGSIAQTECLSLALIWAY